MTLRVWPLSLALALPCAAQAVVVPRIATTGRPAAPEYLSQVFFSSSSPTVLSESRTQSLFDVDDVPVSVATWNALSVRRPAGNAYYCPAFTANATIVLAHGPNAPGRASTFFATNLGTWATTVWNGNVALPTDRSAAAWPAPWQPPFPFAQQFLYIKALGRSLVVDIKQTGNTAGNPWYVEGSTSPVDLGARAANGPGQLGCRSSVGPPAFFTSTETPYAGWLWYLGWAQLPPQALGAAVFGTQGAGSTWNGVSLPFTFPGAWGCTWSVSVELTVPVWSDANGRARCYVQLPDDPALGGGVFYEQAMFPDAAANALGLVATPSNRWTFGDGKAAAALVTSWAGASAPAGGVTLGVAPTYLLN